MLNREWRAQCIELAAEDACPAEPGAQSPPHPHPFNLMVPPSACPTCKRPIHAIENVPVVSWLVLRGKCAGCGTSISWRYPFVELLTGLLSLAVAWKLGLGWAVVAGLVFTWFLIALTFIDIDTQLLPDNITLPFVWLGLFTALVLPLLGAPHTPGEPLPPTLRDSVIGAIAGYMSLWLVYHAFRLATGKEGMGYGDFKLLAAIGAWLGWQLVLPTILISAVIGAVLGVAILSLQKKDRSVPIAFGPFLAIAGWLMLMFGDEVVTRYLHLFP
jgi:leader peptidase (prepilin peptidase)/N-methyltransferase